MSSYAKEKAFREWQGMITIWYAIKIPTPASSSPTGATQHANDFKISLD